MILYLDTFSGISGDMMLGLLVDLGCDLERMEAELGKLPVSGYRLERRDETRHGIGGTRIEVICEADQPHRTWTEIDTMLSEADLEDAPREMTRQIFRRLGEAEAKVHRTPIETIHFHEVGAVDAIVDIAGTAIGLHLLGIKDIVCAPLPLSSGLTRGSHGALPLPAPATLEILCGAPVRDAGCDKELVTPTGAAIAAEIARFGPLPELTPERIGYGVGGWDLDDRPNLLRGILSAGSLSDGLEHDQAVVIETNLDDTSPEWLGSLMGRLLDSGAWDAGYSTLQMKKNRPGIKVTVIAPPALTESLSRLLLRESSAIGVRTWLTRRIKLRRELRTIVTSLGEAEVKLIYEGEQLLRITPEHASCEALAHHSGRPLPEVYRLVSSAAERQFGLEEDR